MPDETQLNGSVRCDVCGEYHDFLTYNGVKVIGCPEVPEGWIIPSPLVVAPMQPETKPTDA